jgi:hypothetical protein
MADRMTPATNGDRIATLVADPAFSASINLHDIRCLPTDPGIAAWSRGKIAFALRHFRYVALKGKQPF